MTGPRRRRRGRGDGVLAVDLGSARTRVYLPGVGVVLDEPTLVAYGANGEIVAVGRDAWVASAEGPARLRMPVRSGLVRDPVGCVTAVRLMLRTAGLSNLTGHDATVCLPLTASDRDAAVLAAVITSATGRRARPVESSLAAGIGIGLDVGQRAPRLVCDIGAGVTEMAAVGDGQVLAGAALRTGMRDFDDEPERSVARIVGLLGRVLDDLPELLAADAVAQPMALSGGGALRPDLVSRLGPACHMDLEVPDLPREVLAAGLAGCSISSHAAA